MATSGRWGGREPRCRSTAKSLGTATQLRHLLEQPLGCNGFVYNMLRQFRTLAALIRDWQALTQVSHVANAVLSYLFAKGFVGYCVAQANVHGMCSLRCRLFMQMIIVVICDNASLFWEIGQRMLKKHA